MDRERILAEIDAYAKKLWRKVGTGYRHYSYSFGRYNYKIHLSNSKLSDLLKDYRKGKLGPKEIVFYLGILEKLQFSRKFGDAAVIRLTAKKMKGYCNRNNYKKYKDTLVGYGLLVPTSDRNWFIVNPRHGHKFFKTAIDKAPEEFKADLENMRRNKKEG